VVEIATRAALVRSRIPGVPYVINPYLGCGHGCRYCYAVFMRQYSRFHQTAPWGSFVEVKVNIAEALRGELARKRTAGTAMLSSVCDPYQPAERRYRLTRQCVEALREFGWGVDILTRSPLVLRDADLLRACLEATVGLSIPTDDERVRAALEPAAPPIASRVVALRRLREAGIRTWVFIAPILPMDPVRLHALIAPHVEYVMLDALNYQGQVAGLFRRHGWERALTPQYAEQTRAELERLFGGQARRP